MRKKMEAVASYLSAKSIFLNILCHLSLKEKYLLFFP